MVASQKGDKTNAHLFSDANVVRVCVSKGPGRQPGRQQGDREEKGSSSADGTGGRLGARFVHGNWRRMDVHRLRRHGMGE